MDIVGGKRALLRELIEIFLREGPRLMADAQRSLQDGDARGLKLASHTLKGSARYFGAQRVVDAAFEVEQAAGRDALDAAEPALRRLETELDQLVPELRAYYEQGIIE